MRTPGSPRTLAWADSWRATIALVLVLTLLRLLYLAFLCPYTLVEDEAHYWEWSRHLGLSYYTKGPGIAWTIHAGTWLFGDSEFGVRAMAPIFLGVMSLAAAGLATDVSRDKRAGFLAALCINLSFLFQFGGILMTIDVPYCAMWALAAWGAWRGLCRASWAGLVVCGLCLGLGFLYKYTALLLLPGLVLFAWTARRELRLPKRWGLVLLLALGAFLVGIAPVIIWNQREGWPTIRHLLGHLGVAGGDMKPSAGRHWSPLWPLEFVAMQFGLHGAIVGLALSTALWMRKRRRQGSPLAEDVGARFLAWCALPLLVFYFVVTFFTDGEGNWTAAAYTTLSSLAGIGAIRGLEQQQSRNREWMAIAEPRPKWGYLRRAPENPRQMFLHIAVVSGIISAIGMMRLDLIAKVPVVGAIVPLGRLTSAPAQAADAGRRLAALGPDAFVIGQHYGRASQLAFYMPGRPKVYCSSSLMGGRKTQYDYWPATNLDDAALLGREALLIGASAEEWKIAFASVEDAGTLAGDHKANRPAFIGRGYLGYPGMKIRTGRVERGGGS